MLFPSLGAHISVAEFQHPDRIWKKLCSKMAHLVVKNGGNKSQLSQIVEDEIAGSVDHLKALSSMVRWTLLIIFEYTSVPSATMLTPARPNIRQKAVTVTTVTM